MKSRRVAGFALVLLIATIVFASASVAFAADTIPAMPTLQVHVPGIGTYTNGATASWLSTDSVDGHFVVDTASARAWVNATAAPATYVKTVNLTRRLDKKRKKIILTPPSAGRHLDVEAAVAAIASELLSEANGNPAQTITLTPVVDQPRFAGKAIVVYLHERRVYLYDGTKLVKKYRCAIGQARYPTPTGVFKIGRKVYMPSWNNPGASWAKNMPARIGPGPNNPLGTRALYVFSGSRDTGVRFHGVPTHENNSIGSAASHGCMRMLRRDVEKFYPLVPVGTPVYILK